MNKKDLALAEELVKLRSYGIFPPELEPEKVIKKRKKYNPSRRDAK